MSERSFRFVLGFLLWASLSSAAYFQTMLPVYILISILLFEFITNWRLTLIFQYIRFGAQACSNSQNLCIKNSFWIFDAERLLRLIIALFIIISYTILPDILWFIPWFTAGMLIMASITNICPMAMFLKWSGLR